MCQVIIQNILSIITFFDQHMKQPKRSTLLLLWLFTSCTTVYTPTTVVTPVFEEKGDMEVQATLRKGSPHPKGAALNIGYAYAFSEKYAAMLNLEYQREPYIRNFRVNNDIMKSRAAEVYLGRYFSSSESASALYFGAGRGYQDKRFAREDAEAFYASDYWMASLLVMHTWKNPAAGERQKVFFTLFCRTVYSHNYNIRVSLENPSVFREFLTHKNVLSVEPGATISTRLGKYHLFFQGILGFSPLDYFDEYARYHTSRPIVLMGLKYDLTKQRP